MTVRLANTADAQAVSELGLLCSSRYNEDPAAWAKAIGDQGVGRSHYVAETSPRAGASEPIIVGYGRFALEHGSTQDSPRYRVYLGVHPESRHRGLGSALLERMLDELRTLGAAAARVRTESGQHETLRFLQRRGFAEYDRKVVLKLDLATLETAAIDRAVAEHIEQIESAGLSVQSLAGWSMQDADCLCRLLPVYNAVGYDVPQPDPYRPVTLDELQRFLANPELSQEGLFVATHAGDPIGFSYLLEAKDGGQAIVGMTGVLPEFRRHGIATALKLKGIQYAHSREISTMVTGASAKNAASLAVNERLGFRRVWEEVRLEKHLD